MRVGSPGAAHGRAGDCVHGSVTQPHKHTNTQTHKHTACQEDGTDNSIRTHPLPRTHPQGAVPNHRNVVCRRKFEQWRLVQIRVCLHLQTRRAHPCDVQHLFDLQTVEVGQPDMAGEARVDARFQRLPRVHKVVFGVQDVSLCVHGEQGVVVGELVRHRPVDEVQVFTEADEQSTVKGEGLPLRKAATRWRYQDTPT